MAPNFQWSPSKLADYKNCPRQFYEKHINKSVPFVKTEAMRWGKQVHKALELAVNSGKPMPDTMRQFRNIAACLSTLEGVKTTEQKVAVDKHLNVVDWFDPSVWGRVIVDYTCVINTGNYALVIDYKTGKVPNKQYYDPTQIIVSALVTLLDNPALETAVARYMYVSHLDKGHAPVTISRSSMDQSWDIIRARVRQIEEDEEYLPIPCGLCRGWCPVKNCKFNKEFGGHR